ncbi:MAG TPA: hypothetical protein VHV81_09595 [Steroidobacteraceae bacterium]|jgi:cobalamin synthase|nr:hypothetical protein [Steroidobacteraceae bacterium]
MSFAGAAAARVSPLVGAAVGAAGGLIYWGAAGVWPSSIAVALAMLAFAVLDPPLVPPSGRLLAVLTVLLKYNALMALSAAKLPYALPPNVSLGIVMIGGHAVARALAVSAAVGSPRSAGARDVPAGISDEASSPSTVDLGIALVIGFLPAVLMGIPGLVGIAAAIAARLGLVAYLRRRPGGEEMAPGAVREGAEIGFYLGALGAWSFV